MNMAFPRASKVQKDGEKAEEQDLMKFLDQNLLTSAGTGPTVPPTPSTYTPQASDGAPGMPPPQA